jgi:hypothetical protein
MIFSSPPPQLAQRCMSMSRTRLSSRAQLTAWPCRDGRCVQRRSGHQVRLGSLVARYWIGTGWYWPRCGLGGGCLTLLCAAQHGDRCRAAAGSARRRERSVHEPPHLISLAPHVSTPRSRPDPLLLLIGTVLLLGAVLVNELLVWPALATSNELAHRGLQTEAVVVTLQRRIDKRLPAQVESAVEAARYERASANGKNARASWFASYRFATGAGETITANSVFVGSYTIPNSHRDSFGRDEAGAALYQRLAPGSPLAVTYLAESPSIHRPSANLQAAAERNLFTRSRWPLLVLFCVPGASVLRTAFRRSVRRPG